MLLSSDYKLAGLTGPEYWEVLDVRAALSTFLSLLYPEVAEGEGGDGVDGPPGHDPAHTGVQAATPDQVFLHLLRQRLHYFDFSQSGAFPLSAE